MYEHPKFTAIICQNFTHPSYCNFQNPDKHKEPPCSRNNPKRITGAECGVDGGTPENPIFIGILGVTGKRWVKRKMWKKAEKVPNIMPKVYPCRRGWVKFLPINQIIKIKNDRK